MTILDFAERVLATAGEPLHYRDITSRILAEGWMTTGNTPWHSVNAMLAVDVKRGPASRFVPHEPGHVRTEPPLRARTYHSRVLDTARVRAAERE